MYTGPHLIKDSLVFGYDTGYGVADNNTSTRFYPGENTTNAVPLSTFIDTSNWTGSGWSGAIAVSTDYNNTLELTSTNGWRTFRINTGITSGGTVTVSYEYRMKTLVTSNVFMLNLNGDHLGSYVNNLGSISAADTQDLGNWKTFTGSWTANSNSNLAIGLRGTDGAGLSDTIYIRNLQVELKGHATPFTATSRSSTQSLIDLKRTTDIDVSNVSFDSTGQPDFDGSSDFMSLGNFDLRPGITLETVCYPHSIPFAVWGQGPTIANRGLHIISTTTSRSFVYGMYGNDCDYSYIPTTNAWHHWVFTYNGTSFEKTFFADGVEQTPVGNTAQNEWIEGSSMLRLGTNYGSGTSYGKANGAIAVAKIYNRPLTSAEIKQNFNVYRNRFGI